MKTRNYSFDIIKFFAIVFIIIHHFGLISNILVKARILVELFFMISGFFIAMKFEKNKHIDYHDFYKNSLKRLYPEYIVVWLVMFISGLIINKNFSSLDGLKTLAEIFMMQNWFEIGTGGINYPMWYLSVMLLSEFFIIYGLNHCSKKSFIIRSVFVVLVIYTSLICFNPMNIEQFYVKFEILYLPFWRGTAALLLGVLSYFLSAFIKEKLQVNKVAFNILYFVLLSTLVAGLFIDCISDYVFLPILFSIVLMSSFDECLLNIKKKSVVVDFMSKYQYSIFVNHAWVVSMYQNVIFPYLPIGTVFHLILIVIITIVISVFMYHIVNWLLIPLRLYVQKREDNRNLEKDKKLKI